MLFVFSSHFAITILWRNVILSLVGKNTKSIINSVDYDHPINLFSSFIQIFHCIMGDTVNTVNVIEKQPLNTFGDNPSSDLSPPSNSNQTATTAEYTQEKWCAHCVSKFFDNHYCDCWCHQFCYELLTCCVKTPYCPCSKCWVFAD